MGELFFETTTTRFHEDAVTDFVEFSGPKTAFMS